jgi:predicted nucleic-acid-binding protein
MIAIDTNIVVRFLTKDDPEQFKQTEQLFSQSETALLVPDSILLETEWVLRFAYKYSSIEVVNGLRKLLGLPNVFIEDTAKIAQVLDWHEQGLDFADALHLANSDALPELITFDDKFIRRANGKSHCKVRKP